MKILDNVYVYDLGLYLKKESVLILSDLQLGYEENLNKQGILVPRFQLEDIKKTLEKLLKKLKPNKVIINGDLKHEFGKISDQEWRDCLRIFDLILNYCKELILIKGNHDLALDPIAKKRDIKVFENLMIGDILILHGHKIEKIPKNIKTIVIGHEHPAIGLREKGRVETFKCFLKGKYKKNNLVVMPSFNFVHFGTDILRGIFLSPFLDKLDEFEVIVVADKMYKFGKIKDIKEDD